MKYLIQESAPFTALEVWFQVCLRFGPVPDGIHRLTVVPSAAGKTSIPLASLKFERVRTSQCNTYTVLQPVLLALSNYLHHDFVTLCTQSPSSWQFEEGYGLFRIFIFVLVLKNQNNAKVDVFRRMTAVQVGSQHENRMLFFCSSSPNVRAILHEPVWLRHNHRARMWWNIHLTTSQFYCKNAFSYASKTCTNSSVSILARVECAFPISMESFCR